MSTLSSPAEGHINTGIVWSELLLIRDKFDQVVVNSCFSVENVQPAKGLSVN